MFDLQSHTLIQSKKSCFSGFISLVCTLTTLPSPEYSPFFSLPYTSFLCAFTPLDRSAQLFSPSTF